MKKFFSQLTSFLSYHNAVPAALVVVALGGSAAFAATATGILPLPAMVAPPSETTPEPVAVDVSALLAANLDAFDFRPTVTSVSETDDSYTVSYSLQTLAPQAIAWSLLEKTGEFSVAKTALDETGLQGYVVGKLKDLENGERAYLARAQDAEKRLAASRTAKPANAFAALIGLALDQIPVPVVEKPAPENVPQQAATAPSIATTAIATTPEETGASADATSTPTKQLAPDDGDVALATSTATSTDTAVIPQTETGATTTDAVIPDTSTTATELNNDAASSTDQAITPESEQTTDTATTTPAD